MVEINGDIIRTNWTGEAHFKQFGRESERERYIYIYIYIYCEREREGERRGGREKKCTRIKCINKPF
jgi:hypothetical protein